MYGIASATRTELGNANAATSRVHPAREGGSRRATTAPKQAVAKATPSRSVQKAARKELASTPKASRATSKRAARKQVASIRGAAHGAQSLHARREFAVANATRAQNQKQKKKHPYAILGGAPGFMRTVELTRRRPTPRG